jgi:hypothetical protein
VLQGERPMARDNRTLGKFQLTGCRRRRAACRRSRSPSTSTPTASSTCRPRTWHRQGAEDHHHRVERPQQGRGRPDDEGGRGARRGGTRKRQGGNRDAQPRPIKRRYAAEKMVQEMGDKLPASDKSGPSRGRLPVCHRAPSPPTTPAAMSKAMEAVTQATCTRPPKRSTSSQAPPALAVVPAGEGPSAGGGPGTPGAGRSRVLEVGRAMSSTRKWWTTK